MLWAESSSVISWPAERLSLRRGAQVELPAVVGVREYSDLGVMTSQFIRFIDDDCGEALYNTPFTCE
jgi:hypothetical protein